VAKQAASRDVLTSPARLDQVLRAAGGALVFDGRGANVLDFALALRGVTSDRLMTLRLPGNSVGTGAGYRGERHEPLARDLFAAVRAERVGGFVAAHPELVGRD
jgi:hypothetical protein